VEALVPLEESLRLGSLVVELVEQVVQVLLGLEELLVQAGLVAEVGWLEDLVLELLVQVLGSLEERQLFQEQLVGLVDLVGVVVKQLHGDMEQLRARR
jgi:hypothetical protein